MSYVDDAARGKVFRGTKTGSGNFDAKLLLGEETNTDTNPNDVKFGVTNQHHIGVWVKNANTGQPFQFNVKVGTSAGDRTMFFVANTGTDFKFGSFLTYYIGTSWNDGTWRYLELDLAPKLAALESGATISEVYGFVVQCKDIYLDDIIISGGAMEKSYQLLPGAAIAGYLGTQAGSAGSWDRWYHHFELGTVIAATDENGDRLGAYAPDITAITDM